MGCCLSTGNAPHSISVSDLNPEGVQQKLDDQKFSRSEGGSRGVHRTLVCVETQADKNEETVITSAKIHFLRSYRIADDEVGIRATDLALGLGRIPAGFYIAVFHSGLEWRTENKAALVESDVEWSGPISM